MSATTEKDAFLTDVRAEIGRDCGPVYGWDAVNRPMIRQWCEAMGVTNPIYTDTAAAQAAGHADVVAPPAMLQAWTLAGINGEYPPQSTDEKPYSALKLFDDNGYSAVVAVNSELSFDRHLNLGEVVYYNMRLTDVSEQKATGLGTGYFVTYVMEFFAEKTGEDEKVGSMLFRLFKFKPAKKPEPITDNAAGGPPKIKRTPPGISDDTSFFWKGLKEGKLLIQRCKETGELRHPPSPCCPTTQSFNWDTVEAKGTGEIYSYVVMHYPEVPPFDHPNPIGLIQLDEGTRLVAQIIGSKPADIRIGQRVQVEFNTFDDDLTLPQFRIVG